MTISNEYTEMVFRLLAAVLTLGTLSLFRWIESQMPIQSFSQFSVRFLRDAVMPEGELRELSETLRIKPAVIEFRLASTSG